MIRRFKAQQFTFVLLLGSGGFVPVGCNFLPQKVATVPRATWASEEEAKRYLPVPDLAVIYIYRDTPIGAEIAMGNLVDGKEVSSTVPRSFTRIEIKPGQHEIISRAENDFPMSIRSRQGVLSPPSYEVRGLETTVQAPSSFRNRGSQRH
jgi:hypothetical protein